jgi:hypothetical protein
MRTAVFAEFAAFFDLALTGRVRAFFGHRDLLQTTLRLSVFCRQAEQFGRSTW